MDKAKTIDKCLQACADWGLIPTEFRQCMTWEEQVLWLEKFLKETVISTFNQNTEAYEELKETVENFFDNLDVQEEINNKLDEMAESGELLEIMQPYFDSLSNKAKCGYTISELPLTRLCRTISNKSNDTYFNLQGGCYIENGKAVKAVTQGDDTKLVEFELATGTVIRESASLSIGHANGLAYDSVNGIIYATGLTGDNAKNLFLINYDDLTYNGVAALDIPDGYGTSGITIDPVTGKSYLSIELTASPNSLRLYEIDLSDYSLTEITIEDNFGYLSTTSNNAIASRDGVVYFVKFNPVMIIGVNTSTGKICNIYNIPKVTGQGYWTRDPQFIDFVTDGNDGEVIIGTTGDDTRNGEYCINQFFRGDLYAGSSNNKNLQDEETPSTIYVDLTSTATNPTGTQSNAFKTIGEALDMSMLHNAVNYILVGTTSTVYPKIVLMPAHKCVNIYSQSNKCKINGITSWSVHPVSLTNVALNTDKTIDFQGVTPNKLSLTNVSIPTNSSYNMVIRNTDLNVDTMPVDSVYNIKCEGNLNTFTGNTIGNMNKIHFGGSGKVTLLTSKTCGEMDLSSTSTSSNSIDLALDAALLDDGQHQFEYRSYVNYSRSIGKVNIPAAGGFANIAVFNLNRLLSIELHRTNDNKFYAVLTKAFTIGADGTLTDSTSSTTGKVNLALVQNF